MEKGKKQTGFDVKQKQAGSYCLLSQRFPIYPHYGMKISYFGQQKILTEKNYTCLVPSHVSTDPEPSAWHIADAQQILVKGM